MRRSFIVEISNDEKINNLIIFQLWENQMWDRMLDLKGF